MQTRCQEKEKPPLTSPAPKANGGILGEVRGTSIDMTLDIVGITEMQKCGLKYVIHILALSDSSPYFSPALRKAST